MNRDRYINAIIANTTLYSVRELVDKPNSRLKELYEQFVENRGRTVADGRSNRTQAVAKDKGSL